jgi:lon-related putative ATP-dependent protease
VSNFKPLNAQDLYRRCDPDQFTFDTTADLDKLEGLIGQSRAVEAVKFGIGIRQEGYNLYALGPHGSGKHTALSQFLEKTSAEEPVPDDWCYANNFEQPHRPVALRLPAGKGVVLRQDIDRLVQELRTTIPAAFESEDYRSRRESLEELLTKEQDHIFKDMQQRARAEDFALMRTQSGLGFAPLRDGEAINPEQFQHLPVETQQSIEQRLAALQTELQTAVRQMQHLERRYREQLKLLDREIASFAVVHLIDELRETYHNQPDVLTYLDSMQEDILNNYEDFHQLEDEKSQELAGIPLPRSLQGPPSTRRYQINVLVDNSNTEGTPVIYQNHPVYPNLVGRIEHITSPAGTLMTDFTLIRPGALHRANGGYLMVDAHKVLMQPHTWEAIKRLLRAGEVTIETTEQQFGLINTISLEPEPIPLDIKIVLFGDRQLYYTLAQYDPDFNELFKVAVDFEEEMERSTENNILYARLIGTLAQKEALKHFDRSAVARVIEHSSRLVNDAEKLSTRMQGIADVLREANYWAEQVNAAVVSAGHVQKAIDAQIHRSGRVKERMQEQIERETILVDTDSEVIGQVNGLSVIGLGQHAFGRPSRITARVRLGHGKVVDIEREVELGGPLHSKGVLILSAYLGAHYVPDHPLSLAASLVFEQSYGGVDGDSASSAELYALLSALAQTPVKQALAVTGSVNQYGQVQAVGGVNEKIEGFFDLCQARGLTRTQGVLIPAANTKHLMLRYDVVQSVAAGQFNVYPVHTIDEGIEILTGLRAGQRGQNGHFPAGTINQLVEARLLAFSERWLTLNKQEGTRT